LKTYADTSFLVRIYLTQSDSPKALAFDIRQAALAKAAGLKVKP